MNASEMTEWLAKLGKLIGQNNMKGGLKVLIGGSAIGGAAAGAAGTALANRIKKKKSKIKK